VLTEAALIAGVGRPRFEKLPPFYIRYLALAEKRFSGPELKQERANVQFKFAASRPIEKHLTTRTNHRRLLMAIAAGL